MNTTQNKIQNYNRECADCLAEISRSGKKPSLFLHVCCAPCSSAVLLKLKDYFRLTLFYYNPNIAPLEEYSKRFGELEKLQEFYRKDFQLQCEIFPASYIHEEFLAAVAGLEMEPEGGSRCERCHALRLGKTAEIAKKNGFDYFCSTLSISPLKNATLINKLGFSLQTENCLWLPNDFKKENGFLQSTQISQKYGLYRQDFCGCEFSRHKPVGSQ